MSVMDSTGSACVDSFRSWATARMSEACEVDDALAGIELYEPEDLPKMIAILRDTERVYMAATDRIRVRLLDEQRQQRKQSKLEEKPYDENPSIEEQLRWCIQTEFRARWMVRAEFPGEVREILEEKLQSRQTTGGSD
jgi:hypothetical protein